MIRTSKPREVKILFIGIRYSLQCKGGAFERNGCSLRKLVLIGFEYLFQLIEHQQTTHPEMTITSGVMCSKKEY